MVKLSNPAGYAWEMNSQWSNPRPLTLNLDEEILKNPWAKAVLHIVQFCSWPGYSIYLRLVTF